MNRKFSISELFGIYTQYFLCLALVILLSPLKAQKSQQNGENFGKETAKPGRDYPNILIITVDNVGYGDYGLYNRGSKISTPVLDRMAKEGVLLTGFYSAGATCTVSRAALLTGRVPQRNKLDYQLAGLAGNYGIGLRHSEILLPEVIKNSAGNYATAAFGKWNIGFAPGSRPVDRGFDEYLGIASGNADHFSHVYAGKHDLFQNNESVNRQGEYSTDMFADATIEFIERNTAQSRPWFVYLPFDAPHSPGDRNIPPDEPNVFKAPDYAFEPYDFTPHEKDPEKRYRAVVTAIDLAMGRILKALDSMGIAENTFIFFYSDNGANVNEVQRRITGTQFSTNAPLRGGRSTLYEGGIRVPALAMWKGTIPSGQVVDTRLWSPDLFVACANLTGATLPQDRFYDGKNLLPVLMGETQKSPHATLYFEDGDDDALYWGDWKIVREKSEEPWKLFNIKEDISEEDNRASKRPELVGKLSAAFEQKKEEIENYHKIQGEKTGCNCN